MDHVDTAALLKGYPIEPGTRESMSGVGERADPFVGPLCVGESDDAIGRRQRAGHPSARRVRAVLDRFAEHLADCCLGRPTGRDRASARGAAPIDRVEPVPLRAPDALHLALALEHRCEDFATANRVRVDAAHRLRFVLQTFFLTA